MEQRYNNSALHEMRLLVDSAYMRVVRLGATIRRGENGFTSPIRCPDRRVGGIRACDLGRNDHDRRDQGGACYVNDRSKARTR